MGDQIQESGASTLRSGGDGVPEESLVVELGGIAVVQLENAVFAHHVGGYVYRGVFTLFVGVFVLWALYGNEESDRYFETNG